MKYSIITIILLFVTSLSAWSVNPFYNFKEGESRYINKIKERKIQNLLKMYSYEELETALNTSLDTTNLNEICSFDIIDKLKRNFSSKNRKIKSLLLFARKNNFIDDTTFKILKKTSKFRLHSSNANEEIERTITDQKDLQTIIASYTMWEKSPACLNESWTSLLSSLSQKIKNYDYSRLQEYNQLAFKSGIITQEKFNTLESARIHKIDKWGITLKSYIKKLEFIQRQYPQNESSKSNFVSQKVKKSKHSLRESLYIKYTPEDIIVIGDLITRFKKRMESSKITLNFYDINDQISEIYTLKPMEEYYASIRMLLMEIDEFKKSGSKVPSYKDLITAAFEVGVATAEEVDYLAEIEFLWSPQKTLWEKVSWMVNTVGGILAIVLPPPYGTLPVLAIIIIQATTTKKDDGTTGDKPFYMIEL